MFGGAVCMYGFLSLYPENCILIAFEFFWPGQWVRNTFYVATNVYTLRHASTSFMKTILILIMCCALRLLYSIVCHFKILVRIHYIGFMNHAVLKTLLWCHYSRKSSDRAEQSRCATSSRTHGVQGDWQLFNWTGGGKILYSQCEDVMRAWAGTPPMPRCPKSRGTPRVMGWMWRYWSLSPSCPCCRLRPRTRTRAPLRTASKALQCLTRRGMALPACSGHNGWEDDRGRSRDAGGWRGTRTAMVVSRMESPPAWCWMSEHIPSVTRVLRPPLCETESETPKPSWVLLSQDFPQLVSLGWRLPSAFTKWTCSLCPKTHTRTHTHTCSVTLSPCFTLSCRE